MFVKEGEYLFLEGDKGTSLVIVKSGMLVGMSKQLRQRHWRNFGPGSIIGEFSLLESKPREYTLRAAENSEVLFIEQKALQRELEHKPGWFQSTLSFLANHCHIAEENLKKSKIVQALPALLFLFSKHLVASGSDNIALATLQKKMLVLNNTEFSETERLLQLLEEFDILKIEGETVRVPNLQIIPLLYEALRYRALNKQVSPDILSITEQLVLTAFVKAVKENGISIRGNKATVPTEMLKAEAKKAMHGGTLTRRIIAPLIASGILEATPAGGQSPVLDDTDSFTADFYHVIDLLELNRIFPLLDKKLV